MKSKQVYPLYPLATPIDLSVNPNLPLVIVDCDDVLYITNEAALEEQNKKYGTSYTLTDITCWGISGNEVIDGRLELFKDPEFVKNQPLYPGAKKFIAELSKIARILFVTAVPPTCMSARAQRIIDDFGANPKQIVIASDKSSIKADYHLDDSAEHILNSSAKHPVLFRRPWNYSVSGVTSVSKYEDFLCFVKYVEQRAPFVGIPSESSFICLVGPSGSGKTEMAIDAFKKFGFRRPKTSTTRKRENDTNYFYEYVSQSEFIKRMNEGTFVETTVYGGEYYGISKATLEKFIQKKHVAIIPMDMCGAMAIKNLYPDRTAIVFVEKNKQELVSEILIKEMPNEEKVLRLLNIDTEMSNRQFCDIVVHKTEDLNKIIL